MRTERKITSKTLSSFLNKSYKGPDLEVNIHKPLSDISDNCLTFAKRYCREFEDILNSNKNILAIVTPEYDNRLACSYIVSESPRLDYLRIIRNFFILEEKIFGISPSTIIEDGAVIGEDPIIGAHCYIGKDVSIGDNVNIHHNVVIIGKVSIGDNCTIKSGAIIGEEGFGFERNEDYVPEAFPHTGMVIIGNNVFIGSNSSVERGTIGATEIQNNVKIDDLVQIGHNSLIGDNTMVTAGTIICGGVEISKNCYIGPNVTIRQRVKVLEKGYIGMGAVVIGDVMPGTTVVGNPAKELIKCK
jgi:UDP-3-O-[3-hydroxymyristoyl] glucosamine N-acyltransferase